MLTKETKVDQITIDENSTVFYREVIRILEGDVQISHSYHRTSLTPGQDLTGHPENVVAIAKAAWTDEVIAAYASQISKLAENAKISE